MAEVSIKVIVGWLRNQKSYITKIPNVEIAVAKSISILVTDDP